MLEVSNLSYNKRSNAPVFSNINFKLAPGEALIVSGKNGSGKTTLLNILAGLIEPSAGKILYSQTNNILENHCLLMEHNLQLVLESTVLANLRALANLYETPELLEVTTHYCKLNDLIEKKVCTLSAGQKKRVYMASMLLNHRMLWLLDEVEVNLDSDGVRMFKTLVQAKLDNGGIVIAASHGEFEGIKSKSLKLT